MWSMRGKKRHIQIRSDRNLPRPCCWGELCLSCWPWVQGPDSEAEGTWACPGTRKRDPHLVCAWNSILEPGSGQHVCTLPAHRMSSLTHVEYKEQDTYLGVQLELRHLDSGVLTGHFERRRQEDGGTPVRPVGVRQVRKNRIHQVAFIQSPRWSPPSPPLAAVYWACGVRTTD